MRALQLLLVRNYTCYYYGYSSRTLPFPDTGFSCAPSGSRLLLDGFPMVFDRSPSATLSWTGDLEINKSRLRTIEEIENYYMEH